MFIKLYRKKKSYKPLWEEYTFSYYPCIFHWDLYFLVKSRLPTSVLSFHSGERWDTLSISCRAILVVITPLSFYLSRNILIYPLILKGRNRIFGWEGLFLFLFLSTSIILACCILASKVSHEKSADILIEDLLYGTNCFSLVAFKILFVLGF